jgi:hypothetical protein
MKNKSLRTIISIYINIDKLKNEREIYIYIYIYYKCHKVSTKAAGRTRSNALAQIHHIVKIVSSDVVCKVHFEEFLFSFSVCSYFCCYNVSEFQSRCVHLSKCVLWFFQFIVVFFQTSKHIKLKLTLAGPLEIANAKYIPNINH